MVYFSIMLHQTTDIMFIQNYFIFFIASMMRLRNAIYMWTVSPKSFFFGKKTDDTFLVYPEGRRNQKTYKKWKFCKYKLIFCLLSRCFKIKCLKAKNIFFTFIFMIVNISENIIVKCYVGYIVRVRKNPLYKKLSWVSSIDGNEIGLSLCHVRSNPIQSKFYDVVTKYAPCSKWTENISSLFVNYVHKFKEILDTPL